MYSRRMRELTPYVPGEQPRNREYVKLNTNENPFPPAPGITRILREYAAEELRLYPDPDSTNLRETFAARYGVSDKQVFCGNGSDEVLSLLFFSFFDREFGPVLFPSVTYSFYPVFCSFYGLVGETVPMGDNFSIDLELIARRAMEGNTSGIVFANPNAPTGLAIPAVTIRELLDRIPSDRLVVIDEAYADYGGESMVPWINDYPNLLIVGTLSKSYALAGLRLGFALGQESLIQALSSAKDSFNSYPVSRLAQVLASEALRDVDYFERRRDELITIRETSAAELRRRGWEVLESRTNFLFARPHALAAEEIYKRLRDEGILVRFFSNPLTSEYLRITIGTNGQMKQLFEALTRIGS